MPANRAFAALPAGAAGTGILPVRTSYRQSRLAHHGGELVGPFGVQPALQEAADLGNAGVGEIGQRPGAVPDPGQTSIEIVSSTIACVTLSAPIRYASAKALSRCSMYCRGVERRSAIYSWAGSSKTSDGSTPSSRHCSRIQDMLREGDTLVMPKLDRLARSVPDAHAIAGKLEGNGAKLALGARSGPPG
ncbi:MAG: recombinase family protein [Albidovulum sp.]|nr:recombinase family protein [Albidovulum sp.]